MAESVETGETYSGDFYCVKCKEKRAGRGQGRRDERPSHGQGHVPRLRHQPQPHPRQGLSRAVEQSRRAVHPVGWTALAH